jgi:radical SAM family uncharacterized protein/radical SAM-linked protein
MTQPPVAADDGRFAAHPYASFLELVEKPARYTGGEVGSAACDWDKVQARVCLAFPDVYDIGMSHLGFKILYKVLNDDPRTLAERAYCPWVDMDRELRARGLPLVSLESYRPLCDFDVVGFSLQYELTYTNVLSMLDLGRIPLRTDARGEEDPLVVAGGPAATHPEPVADFFDAIVIGDGEAKLTEVALSWTEAKGQGLDRAARLRRLAELGGVYVPSLYTVAPDPDTGLGVVQAPAEDLPFPIERTMVKLDDYPFPDDGPVGGPEAIFDRVSVEITRGCTEGCRFCQAGMIYRPVQERDPQQVIDTVLSAVKKSGNDEVSLTALSTADVSYIHPLISQLAPELEKQGVSLSVASLRAYGLAPELLDELRRVRAGGLTFAPEAGSQRMRDVVNKNVTEEQLAETAERVFSRGFPRMKLYFMIGLPTEEDDDVLGTVQTGARTAAIGKKAAGKRVEVTVSVSTHVPKPHTPFQWAAMDPLSEIERKQAMLADEARQYRGVKLRTHDSRSSVLEGIMARGDRRLSDVIERAWRNGCYFDSWDEKLNLASWEEALSHFEVETGPYLRTLPVTARLPWSHIDVGLEDGFLLREYRKALQDRLSPPCGKVAGAFVHHTNLDDAGTDARRLVCYDCGVACDMTQMRSERLVYLDRLGAKERPVPPAPLAEPERRKKAGPKIGDPDKGHRYRIRFEKKGPVALLGHLDLIREIPRIFRRLEVAQVYTGGYHPKPDMSFAPALSLGSMSLDEYVDLRLMPALDRDGLAELMARMNAASPEGLVFLDAVELNRKQDPPIGKVIHGARYLIGFARSALDAKDPEAWLAERCEALMASESLPMMRRKKKRLGRKVDIRRFLHKLAPMSAADMAPLLARAGIAGDLVGLEAIVAIEPDGSARTREIAAALMDLTNGNDAPPHRCVRLATYGQVGDGLHSPLSLIAFRTAADPPFVAL